MIDSKERGMEKSIRNSGDSEDSATKFACRSFNPCVRSTGSDIGLWLMITPRGMAIGFSLLLMQAKLET